MNIVRKAVSALGGIFLAALLIAALVPKATRAIVATLVQVTNTSANPVPVETVRQAASNFLTLEATGIPLFGAGAWYQIFPDGSEATSGYALPAGEQLVVTDVLVAVQCSGACPKAGAQTSVVLPPAAGFGEVGPYYYVAALNYEADGFGGVFAAHSDHLTSGIVFSTLPSAHFNTGYGLDSGESFSVTIQGYLAP
jgi:hypothetical protein